MLKKIFITLAFIILLHKSQCSHNDPSIYEEQDEQNSDKQSQQTIHTLKGHYNEEAKRISKCRENKTSTKNINSKSAIFAQNNTDFLNLKVKSNYNTTHDANDIELKVLTEMLKDVESFSHQSNPEKELAKVTKNTNDDNAYVVDKTQKQFEFESLLIKNIVPKLPKEIEGDDEDTMTDVKINNRRLNPDNGNQAESPKIYFGPLQNPTSRSYTPSDLSNPNRKIVQGYDIYYNSPNTVMKNDKETNQYSTYQSTMPSSGVTTDSNKHLKSKQNSDDDLYRNLNKNASFADLQFRRDPTKGAGISDMDRSNMMLIHHPRVCYACSSTNDPSCWSPDRRTKTKYCRVDHSACLTKTYFHKGQSFVIRDCGNSCFNRGLSELGIHYRSCTICHYDLCNAAESVRISATTIIMTLIAISFYKITA